MEKIMNSSLNAKHLLEIRHFISLKTRPKGPFVTSLSIKFEVIYSILISLRDLGSHSREPLVLIVKTSLRTNPPCHNHRTPILASIMCRVTPKEWGHPSNKGP